MLKGIPNIISPELLKILDEMGYGALRCAAHRWCRTPRRQDS